MADFLLYWKYFWRDNQDDLDDRDFYWHTKQQGFWRNAEVGDSLWVVTSGGDQVPDEWRLVDHFVVQGKSTNFDYDRPYCIVGDPTLSEAFEIQTQSDLTPLLHRLEFRSGTRLTVSGREIGNAIQMIRPLSEADGLLLKDYARELETIDTGLGTLNGILGISDEDFSPRRTATGAGFGNPETNRKVERAAVAAVTAWYESDGWNVESVEARKCGYDLLCQQGSKEKHVEVKGVQGGMVAFIITAAEVRQAENDSGFVLCVATSALTDKPELHFYDSTTFASEFELAPLAYRAILRKPTDDARFTRAMLWQTIEFSR